MTQQRIDFEKYLFFKKARPRAIKSFLTHVKLKIPVVKCFISLILFKLSVAGIWFDILVTTNQNTVLWLIL